MSIKAHQIKFAPNKTYKTQANVVKAVEAKLGANEPHFGAADVHWFIMQGDDGRYFPVFVGERALQHGMHFNFPCVN